MLADKKMTAQMVDMIWGVASPSPFDYGTNVYQ